MGHNMDVASSNDTALDEIPKLGTIHYILITAGLVLAALLLVLAVAYSGGTDNVDPPISGGPVDGGGDRDDPSTGETPIDINPIESFLPRTGQGSTCTEPVGVDLIPGFSARLTINGIEIAPEEINGAVGDVTAGSSLGEVTWGPEEGCPRGEVLRPQNNRLEACVYRNTDGPDSCRTFVHSFDAL